MSSYMKKIYAVTICGLFCLFLIVNLSFAQTVGEKILVSTDFSQVLSQALVDGTRLEIVRAIPRNYAPDAYLQYIKKHFADFSGLAREADSVISLASVWPADPLYPQARRANIRIVNIDAGSPLDGTRSGVPLLQLPDGKSAPQAWASPGNAARMADIVATDLMQLYADAGKQIQSNLDSLKRELFKLRTRYETALAELSSFEVIAFTSDYYYLTDEFGLMITDFLLKPEIKWQQEDMDILKEKLASGGIKGVLCAWEPKKEIKKVITDSGARVIVMKKFTSKEGGGEKAQLLDYYQHNLDALLTGLKD